VIIPWLISPTAWLWKVNNLWCDSPHGRWDWRQGGADGNSYYPPPACRRCVCHRARGSDCMTSQRICSAAWVWVQSRSYVY
jgi:hypothetical protein